MKNTMKWMILLATLVVTMPVSAQFSGLKGLAKGAKQKVTQTTNTRTNTQTVEGANRRTTEGVAETPMTTQSQTQRSAAPWPMVSDSPRYKDNMGLRDFLMNIADVSDEEISTLHDQMFARFRENASIIKANGADSYDAQQENGRFIGFFWNMNQVLNMCVSNSMTSNGTLTPDEAYYMVQSRQGGGIGYYVMQKDGAFRFTTYKGDGVFLNAEELAQAKDSYIRMRKWQTLSYQLHIVMQECGYEVDPALRVVYNRSGMYANAVEKACEANNPENIERKPRPAAGSMHASLKAQALAVAKADDADVVDIIITSNQWDVKMKGLVPVNRNVYGYYIYKDEQGLQCYSRMWTEDYIGNGKYGNLRKGGVGVGSPFYIK